MITSKRLLKQKNIIHGFFNRDGGKSTGIYKSLNCGLGSNDNKGKVKKNLKIVKNKVSKKSKDIFLMHQTHSNKVVYIGKNFNFNKGKIKADAVITEEKKVPIGVLTADCVPILLFDKRRNMIAAVHAGWKGAYKGIINKVVKLMTNMGCEKKNIIAAIGPSIQKESYNVGEDFRKKFIKKDKRNNRFFTNKKNMIFFNLPNFVKSQLKSNRIVKIDTIKIDTFIEKNNFFSARRSLISKHDDYGRNISIIMIN